MTKLWKPGEKVRVKQSVLDDDPDLAQAIAGKPGRVVRVHGGKQWPVEVAFGDDVDTFYFNDTELVGDNRL